jgi:WD40 repeat protein/serine/threonine protein kinase
MNERDLFIAALQKEAPADRRAYLDEACKGNENLRRGVEALLEVHDRAGSFLESPVADLVSGVDGPQTAHPGTVIGPYKLLEQIGEGGFGVVYLAEQQQPVRRKVAVKVLKPGMDTKQVVARFEAERQALALMDHTNIARVLDAGASDSGRPYFVMELVRGISITPFCDQSHLPVRERLELFLSVCQAVQHAHQKGIIHRDLKPSNVLVTLHESTPLVKVIDFGIAKALGPERLTDKTLVTGLVHMIGTPLYMSPEQAEMSGQDADTRTDIYALGVLLYELLTGTTPFDKERLKEVSCDEIRRIIREEEPPKPSTRISVLGKAAAMVSANRQSEPRRLSQLFHGELDWIVMKALEKDRNRRYDTASSFAADVQRYLHDEPVQACPPSAGYRLRKFARKYRTPLSVAAAVLVLLAAVAGVASVGYVREAAERAEADRQREEAQRQRAAAEAAEQKIRRQWYAASISAMQQAWDTGQIGRLRALLAETESYSDRGFEWYYCQRLCHRELQTFIGHHAGVRAVCWSPDGKWLTTGGKDGTVKVWEAASGRELRTLRGHADGVTSVSWSPDGKWLATGSYDGTAKVWDAAGGREPLTLKGHTDNVKSVSWSPDGKRLATASADGTAKLWDAADGRQLLTFKGHTNQGQHHHAVQSVSWSPNGKLLATGGWGTAMLWDTTTSRKPLRVLSGHTNLVTAVSWSPDGKWLATGSWDGTAKLWDATKGEEVLSLQGRLGPVFCVSWSPDGKWLATGTADGTAKVWEAAKGREQLRLQGHTELIYWVAWSPDGKRLATASLDGTAKVWDAVEGREPLTLRGHAGEVGSVSWSPDGKRLATGSRDETAKVWEVAGRRELRTLPGHKSLVGSVSWSPDGKWLATGSWDGTAKVWDLTGRQEPLTLQVQASRVLSVSWSADSRRLATANSDGTAKVWDAADGSVLLILKGHTGPVFSVAWSPDGKWLATGSADGTAKVWDATSGRQVRNLKEHTRLVHCVSWSPDSRRLATGSMDRTAKVWDAADGSVLLTLKGHRSLVRSVSWSPDGRRLATGSEDVTGKVWDAVDGRELLTLTGPVGSVSWSPDGIFLATGCWDGTAKVWDAASAEAVQDWSRQDRALEECLALNAFYGPRAQGFLQTWLLLLPLPLAPGMSGAAGLDQQQLAGEAQLRPRPGERVPVGTRELVWQEHRSLEALVDFNAVLGQVMERSVVYAVCYLESEQARDGLWLQVGSGNQAKAYINGQQIYSRRQWGQSLEDLETVGPVALKQGTNVLLFKVVNEGSSCEGCCVRLVDAADLAGGHMYWTDFFTADIQRANLDGTGRPTLVGHLQAPTGALALDITGDKMYWWRAAPFDADRDIRRANLDGSGQEILIPNTGAGNEVSSITLDVVDGKMYWTGLENGDIRRANLDGSGQEVLVRNLNKPGGVALDVARGKMYWADDSDISRANLDGSGQEILITGLSSLSGLALDVGTPGTAVFYALAAPASIPPGTAFDLTVTAADPYGTIDIHYQGTVTFSSSDADPDIVLPADYTFTPGDAGVHAFPGGVTLNTPGDQTITVTDTVSGISRTVTVTVVAPN